MNEREELEEAYKATKKEIQLELGKIKEALAQIEGSKKLIDSLGDRLVELQKDYEKSKG